MFNIYGQVWRDVIIVGNGVRRTRPTLHYNTVLRGNAVLRVVCLRCMSDNSRKPNVANAQLADALQGLFVEVVHLPTAIFGNRSPPFVSEVAIAEKPWKHLIYDNLVVHDGVFIPKVERRKALPSNDYSMPCAATALSMRPIMPCKALPGPHSVKSLAPSFIMFCTLEVHLTELVSCAMRFFLISSGAV